ncbi:hypothetical protein BZL29_4556 [Mycobacterium kansasii]|uniref:Uncharacterized protein n=1 Tax=Mycobacterium kansasii TaxID=1768 RepID=A0A1V3X9A7_MYCKA|nr:hypothetical protein BZL29_4556 [Mycobacterium kansasii]
MDRWHHGPAFALTGRLYRVTNLPNVMWHFVAIVDLVGKFCTQLSEGYTSCGHFVSHRPGE